MADTVARLIEFLLAPFLFLVMAVTVLTTLLFFAVGWSAGALIAGWRSGIGRKGGGG